MESIFMPKVAELMRMKKFLEDRLHVKIKVARKLVSVSSDDALDEYEAIRVLEAMNYGFSARDAVMVRDEDIAFEVVHIRSHTRRKNLELVRGRIIGKRGKTLNTIEQISDCIIKIYENDIAIIAPADEMQYVLTAITNILKGTKQTNSYKYLERVNTKKKKGKN